MQSFSLFSSLLLPSYTCGFIICMQQLSCATLPTALLWVSYKISVGRLTNILKSVHKNWNSWTLPKPGSQHTKNGTTIPPTQLCGKGSKFANHSASSTFSLDFPSGLDSKVSVYNAGNWGSIPVRRSLEKMAIHSECYYWKNPM